MARVLVSLSHARALRTIGPALEALEARGHELALTVEEPDRHADDGGSATLRAWATGSRSLLDGPRRTDGGRSRVAAGLRAALDFADWQDDRRGAWPGPRARAATWVPGPLAAGYLRLGSRGRRAVRGAARAGERRLTPRHVAGRLLRESAADAVLLTPGVLPGSRQAELLRAARRAGVPTCLAVASWDNLTTKGLLHELPDRLTVWNEAQADEARRIHGVPPERMAITGAVALDDAVPERPALDRAAFATAHGLDPDRPFVLYVGSSTTIVPDEAAAVGRWHAGLVGDGARPQVLVRPHPLAPLPDGAVPPGIAVHRTGSLGDALHHCAAVVGVTTSAMLEAALVGRPVLTWDDPLTRPGRDGQPHHAHLRELVRLGPTAAAHAADLAAALATDGTPDPRSLAFARSFLRPFGLREPAGPRLADAVEALLVEDAR